MRPDLLNALFADVTVLKGVGPRIAKAIEKLAGPRVVDLIWHLPSGVIDRRHKPALPKAQDGMVATFTVRVESHQPSPGKRGPYRVLCSNDTGFITLTFFNARADYLTRLLPEGETRVISGQVSHYRDEIQMTHPDFVLTLAEATEMPEIEPVYPLTAGLTTRPLGKAISGALDRIPLLPEWQDSAWLSARGWPSFSAAVAEAHRPNDLGDLDPKSDARQRLAFDELLANQLALALIRASQRERPGRSVGGNGKITARLRDDLPYQLTGAQERVITEIAGDMATPSRMLRLLQGDVGSGKTVVALFAMATAVEAGAQAALMAPTEVLARQHYQSLGPLCTACGLQLALLTGRDKGKRRRELLERLENGEIDILVGTHALFQADVTFKDLALAIIDEQHRFGVHQRLTLTEKGAAVDVLVMTATPIPRTLTLTAYGDMEVSRLDEKPAGRQPIDTRTLPLSRLEAVMDGIGRKLANGDRIYWVCPLVEESELIDLAAAEDRYAALQQRYGEKVGLVHGQMPAAQKDAAMADFTAGKTQILVATTVIEVGVDVPEATVMVIEHAERFGLAQLHQLRGRIGRGGQTGDCLLLYHPELGETAKKRLSIMRQCDDGFVIAEEDLRLRGAGEVLGTRQSGMPNFRLADLAIHDDLMQVARDDARLILNRDPGLNGGENGSSASNRAEALRILLYLFERDAAVKFLRSG